MTRKPYDSDCSDPEWEFVAPYVTLMTQDAPQRNYDLRAVYNALRYLVRSGCSWRLWPHDFPPYYAVDSQFHRWLKARVCEAMTHDLRIFLRSRRRARRAPDGGPLRLAHLAIDARQRRGRRV